MMILVAVVYRCEAQHDFSRFQVKVKGGKNQCLMTMIVMMMMMMMMMMMAMMMMTAMKMMQITA